jgi:uncharacterized protein with HEPN domain
MPERNDLVYVRHILDAIDRIRKYTEGLNQVDFVADEKTQDAVIRQLEIIGEASKQVSAAFRQEHEAIPWSDMARMRDLLIHHYFGVDLSVVWDTAAQDLPGLAPLLLGLITRHTQT